MLFALAGLAESAPNVARFMKSARQGNAHRVNIFLKAGGDVNAKGDDDNGNTALMWAAMENQKEIAAMLIEAGADVNAKNELQGNALRSAVKNQHKEIVEMLIKASAIIDDHTILSYCKRGDDCNKEILEILTSTKNERYHKKIVAMIKTKADLNTKDEAGATMIMRATLHGQKENVRLLLNAKADVHEKNNGGGTVLMVAAMSGNLEIAAMLVNAGVDVNAKDDRGGTAISKTVDYDSQEILQLLIDAKANVNVEDGRGRGDSVLFAAVHQGRKEIVEMLINANVDIHAKNGKGETILMKAYDSGHMEIVELLIVANADVNANDLEEEPALTREEVTSAIVHGTWGQPPLDLELLDEILENMIDTKTDLDTKDMEGKTALMFAVEQGQTKNVRVLINSKADVNAKDKSGRTGQDFF